MLKLEELDTNKYSDQANKEPDNLTEKKHPNTDNIFQSCKSTKDIEYRFSEFHYDKDKGGFVCLICSGSSESESDVFQYEPSLEQDFSNSVHSDKFRFLKRYLKRHLLRQCHIEALTDIDAKHDVLLKEDNRNKAVGMRIGRICYYLFKKGRPDTDFPTLLYFLKQKLHQTGFRPACKILADKATHKHRSRQLMAVLFLTLPSCWLHS